MLVLAERHATDVVKVMQQGQADAMKTVPSRLEHQRELSHAEPCKHERVATRVLRSCREDLGRAVPRMAIW